MFTGIIYGLGRVTVIKPSAGEVELTITPEFKWDGPLAIGESIAVSGVCLTVTKATDRTFSALASAETISRSTFRDLQLGDYLNLERALRLADRLGGHLVTGHVDDMGQIKERRQTGQSIIFIFSLPEQLSAHLVEKGSIAVDGISLTVNQVMTGSFSVNIIPHTAQATTLGFKKTGDYVNLETDLIGKYVARWLGRETAGSKIDKKFLAEHGFI